MDNQRIINQRWKKTEKEFRSNLKRIRQLYKDVADDTADLVKTLGVDYTNLNKIVPQSVKRQVKRKIDEWKKEGIVKGYFAYVIASFTRYTYARVLELLINGLYMQTWKKVNSVSNRIFKTAAQDCYDQGRKDLGKEPKILKWAAILPFLTIQDLDVSYEQYLMTLCQTASEEMYYQVLNVIRMDGNVTAERLYVLVTKQANRILNVKNGKESGIIVDIGRQAGNNGYTAAAEGKDELVKFIAEMDDKTTEMCRSLDGQIFHTNAWNKFTRYSEYYKGSHTFNWFGLERGLNMPPINDHFHWCRSTLTYQLKINRKEEFRSGRVDVTDKWLADQKEKRGVEENRDYIVGNDGKKYKRGDEGVDVTFEPNTEDRDAAKWWADIKGGSVKLNPRLNHPEGIKTADLEIDGKQVEVKTPTGSSKNTIKNQLRKRKQAETYLINIEKTGLSDESAIDQVSKVFADPELYYVNTIVLRRGSELIKVYERI